MRIWMTLGCVLALAGFARGAEAAGKPVIEIHAVVDCHAADSVKLAAASQGGGCMARTAIVKGSDFTGIGHVRYGPGNDMLVVAMSADAHKRYFAFTRAHVLKPEAVLIDGRVVSMPVIAQPERGDALEIPGLSSGQIDALVTRFRAPAHGG